MKAIAIEAGNARVVGAAASGFEPVVEALANNFRQLGEVGAACAVYYRGRPVVDVWGGMADPHSARPWAHDTIVLVFSAAKGPTALCIHRLAESGLLDIDRPIAHYWPAFGCNGKAEITTGMVLSHRAGLAAVDGDLTLEQVLAWDPVVTAIAAQAPNWEPGSRHGYHARSFGWILGELIKCITGRSAGQYLAEEIAGPLGLHYWVGLPAEEIPRCARLLPPAGGSEEVATLLGTESLTTSVMTGPSGLFGYNDMWNLPEVLRAEMPSSNGVGDARSLARLYAALIGEVDGMRLLGTRQLTRACEQQACGSDAVILRDTCFSRGFALAPMLAPGAGPNSFGHPGAGGALAFADPDAELGFAYVMNDMRFDPEGDPRSEGLVEATYRCLETAPASPP